MTERTHRAEVGERERADEVGAVAYEAAADRGRLVRRDLIRWGPVFAGLVVTIATLVVLAALGVALGLSATEPGEQGFATIDTAAWIYSIAVGVLAFFLGGFVAGRTAATGGSGASAFNGFMVGATTIALIVVVVGAGVGSVLGAAAANLGQISDFAQTTGGVDTAAVQDAFAQAESDAWGTVIGLVLALALATLGGLLGRRGEAEGVPVRH